MNGTALTFADGRFDIVASSMVTHHVRNWEQVLEEMVRVLRPGGYLIYTDLMFPGWLAEAGRLLVPVMGFPSRKRLEAFAARNGLCKQFQSRNGMRLRTVFCKSAKPQVSTRGDSNSGSTERGAPSQ
jgi:ubiquinone/menaquinone biosynthesis C-methylase UbiE